MKRTVVSRKHLPSHWPITFTWLVLISQELWPLPGWGLGVLWTVVVLVWVIVAFDVFNAEQRSPFEK